MLPSFFHLLVPPSLQWFHSEVNERLWAFLPPASTPDGNEQIFPNHFRVGGLTPIDPVSMSSHPGSVPGSDLLLGRGHGLIPGFRVQRGVSPCLDARGWEWRLGSSSKENQNDVSRRRGLKGKQTKTPDVL